MPTINYAKVSISDYLKQLSSREPVPGGGSAAALTAAIGAGLLSMVTQYSIGRKTNTKATDARLKNILKSLQIQQQRLLELSSLDAEAYLAVSAARTKDKKAQKKASRYAAVVPREVCRLSYKALDVAPFLVAYGNPYLLSDVQVAIELLHAGYNGAVVMVKINT